MGRRQFMCHFYFNYTLLMKLITQYTRGGSNIDGEGRWNEIKNLIKVNSKLYEHITKKLWKILESYANVLHGTR